MHPSVYCVDTSCNAIFLFRSMGEMRSGLEAFSFRLVVFCQGRLAIVAAFVLALVLIEKHLIEKHLALRLFADLIEGLLDVVAFLLVIWIRAVGVMPSTLIGDPESIKQAPKTGVGLKAKPGSALLTNCLQGPTRLLDKRPRVASDDRKELFFGFFCRVMFGGNMFGGKRRAQSPRPSLINSPSKPSSRQRWYQP